MSDLRMTEGYCAECGCRLPEFGWYGVEYDDKFEKQIRFWCWPACMIEWSNKQAQTSA